MALSVGGFVCWWLCLLVALSVGGFVTVFCTVKHLQSMWTELVALSVDGFVS